MTLGDLIDCLGTDQPVYGLRYGMGDPGTDRHLSLPRMEELASHYIDEMQGLQPEGPYFLMGHSIGGVIAYEMARQLVAKGIQVGLLAMFDSHLTMPARSHESPFQVLIRMKHMGVLEILKWFSYEPRIKLRRVKQYIQLTIPGTVRYSPYSHNVLPSIALLRIYQPKPLTHKAVLFQAVEPTPCIGKHAAKDWLKYHPIQYVPDQVPEEGWKKYIQGRLDIENIYNSDHNSIVLKPHSAILAAKLRLEMDAVLGNP